MRIWTSYFGNAKKLEKKCPDIHLVSIAGYSPPWFTGTKFSALAPKKWWWKIWHDSFKDDLESEESRAWYTERYYETVLSSFNPPSSLETMLEKIGNDICFLCYETPEKFCHRHIVASWLETSLEKTVLEWRDPDALDIGIAEKLFSSIGLKLEELPSSQVSAAKKIWKIVNPSFDGHDAAPMIGDIWTIFNYLDSKPEFKCWRTGDFATLSVVDNPYFGNTYEELAIKSKLLG